MNWNYNGMDALLAIFAWVKWIFIILDAVILAAFVFALRKARQFRPALAPRSVKKAATLSRSSLRSDWAKISAKFEENTPDSLKVAIIEADKLTDHILKESGFEGEHMADRLEKLAPHGLTSFDRLWRAHRLRNEIVHSPDFNLNHQLAERTIRDYEAFLREVKILESK